MWGKVLLLCAAVGAVGAKEHHHLVDFTVDHATKMCRMLARDMKAKKGFQPRKRCEYVVDQIEEFVSESAADVMSKVKEQNMPDIIKAAKHQSNVNEMRKQLRVIAEWALKPKKTPKEKDTQLKIRTSMNQWLLNVITQQTKNDASALPPETIRKLREQGMNIGGNEEDEIEEDEYESESWGVH